MPSRLNQSVAKVCKIAPATATKPAFMCHGFPKMRSMTPMDGYIKKLICSGMPYWNIAAKQT